MTELIFTTNPGLEDIVVAECSALLDAANLPSATFELKPYNLGGYIRVQSQVPFAQLYALARQMRAIHHIQRPIHSFALPSAQPLDAIARAVYDQGFPEMTDAQTFRVTSKRTGRHGFTSVDVQKVAGAALVEKYGCKVNLTNYDVNVLVNVFGARCYIAVQLTQTPLDLRFDFVYRPRVAIKTNLAYALLHQVDLSGASSGARDDGQPPALLDPFCGAGTILLEAATCLPNVAIYGSDRFEKPVQWARDNVDAANLAQRIRVQQADARDLHTIYPNQRFRLIVTNPPFGKHIGPNTNFVSLYRAFLMSAWHVLEPGGRIAMLVWKRAAFNRVAHNLDYTVRHVRIVDVGGLFPGLFVLEKGGK